MSAPFDWNVFLDAAIKKEPINLRAARERANDWSLCACGEQCAAIPRREGGAPEDSALFKYGKDFNTRVIEGQWIRAREVLKMIEARSSEILEQMRKEGKL